MIYSTDLHPILVFYAQKNNSPFIAIDLFLDFLGKTAKRYSTGYPSWKKWLEGREVKFWSEMSALIAEGKCEYISDTDNNHIIVTTYYPDLINDIYQNADNDADLPFPCEESMGIILPQSQIKFLCSESDFMSALDAKGNTANQIMKINFPDDFGSALLLFQMLPNQIAETAILKVRNYLKRYGNREYAYHKLSIPLQGKEVFLKKQLDEIFARPLDCFNDIKEGRELSYTFWTHFCALVKNDLKKKQDRLPIDISAFQSFCIIETITGYYRTISVKQLEVEQAFRSLESCLSRPPYLFSMSQIVNFTDSAGKALLGQYMKEELELWVKKHTTESKNNELPPLFIFKSSVTDDKYLLLRDKMLAFCTRLLIEARLLIKDTILKQWSRLIMEYKDQPAMENDEQFEKELLKIAKKQCPDLMTLLVDPKFLMVYQEAEKSPGGVPSSVVIFNKGVLLPYSLIFQLHRKDVLYSARNVLPFWYSIPILFAVVGFFKKLFRKKENAKSLLAKEIDRDGEIIGEISKVGEIRAAAAELEILLIPAGHTLKSYLEELEDRWSRIIDRKARDNLITDVKFLARDNLRHIMKLNKLFKPSHEVINDIVANLINRNKALNSLSAKDSLSLYLKLYVIKLLENIK